MRAILQRVLAASLIIDNRVISSIQKGLLIYVCFSSQDTLKEGAWLARKIPQLRIYSDTTAKYVKSLSDFDASILVIPNFTLYAEVKNGTRPSFFSGISFEDAKNLFENFIEQCRSYTHCHAGIFGASMQIQAIADGPVNVIIDVPHQT